MAKQTKNEGSKKGLPVTGIMGIALLFVVVSISYSSYVVFFGTEGIVPKAMLVPQALFATVILVKKFSK